MPVIVAIELVLMAPSTHAVPQPVVEAEGYISATFTF